MKSDLSTILIAEDDLEEQQLILIAFLTISDDYELIFASNGMEAMEKLKVLYLSEKLPSLVVLDVNMPIQDGLSTLKEVRLVPEYLHLPVIMYSKSNSDKLINECMSAGCTDYIIKPYFFEAILDSIKKMLPYCIPE